MIILFYTYFFLSRLGLPFLPLCGRGLFRLNPFFRYIDFADLVKSRVVQHGTLSTGFYIPNFMIKKVFIGKVNGFGLPIVDQHLIFSIFISTLA